MPEESMEIFNYLIDNEYLILENNIEPKKQIFELLNDRKILLIVTEEFDSIFSFEQYSNINWICFKDLLQNIGLESEKEIDALDSYILMRVYDLAHKYLTSYEKIVFLVNNPNISIMKKLTKIFSELNKTICYSIVDNNLFFYFVHIPNESPCFNCFNLRIKARLDDEPQINYFSFKHMPQLQVNKYLNSKNINFQIVLDIALRMLIGRNLKDIYKNVGNVLIIDLDTMEVAVEKLYKVPYCEVCGYE